VTGTAEVATVQVEVDGVPIEVRRVGSGPDVLFVHGVYVNGHVWDDLAGLIADRFTCWVPTLPLGAHASPVPSGWKPTLDDLASLVPGLLDALDLCDVTVVGNDSGGGFVLLALGGGAAGIARIGRVVLTNCDSFDHLPPKAFGPIVALCRAVPIAGRALLRVMLTTEVGRKQFMNSVASTSVSAERRQQFFGTKRVLADAVRVTAGLRPTAAHHAMAWLADLELPVAVVWGDADKFFPRSDAERLLVAIPHATLTRVAGARTYVQIDDPAAVAAAITGGTHRG
jgi:pimeloyl-ACP methyl ester carboxylesterase